MIALAMTAAQSGPSALETMLESLPAPIYVTDAQGTIIAFNSACIHFAGRTPVPGRDRWCVTWKLYSEAGEPMAHDQCPMALAIKEGRRVRGALAVAERPDGTKVMFTPYPTPIYDAGGALAGAVNILIDVTDSRQAELLHVQAMRCRRLAQSVTDQQAVDTLLLMAAEYDEKAGRLGRA